MSDDEAYNVAHVPTVWRNAQHEVRSESPIIHPDSVSAEERAMLSAKRVCGQCRYFERAHGQAEMQAQRFLERLVREDNWQVRHLASPVNELGICGAHDSGQGNDQVLTGTRHVACDQFRPNRGLVSLRRSSLDD